MRQSIAVSGLVAAFSLVLIAAPGIANATCNQRKATGTVIGGLGGALLGNSISDGGGGAIIGGLGGAVVGHEIGRSGCARARPTAYRGSYRSAPAARAAAPRPAPRVYYDQYGQKVSAPATVAAASSAPAFTPASYGTPAGYGAYGAPAAYGSAQAACRTETRNFYDERGKLVQRSVRTCDR